MVDSSINGLVNLPSPTPSWWWTILMTTLWRRIDISAWLT